MIVAFIDASEQRGIDWCIDSLENPSDRAWGSSLAPRVRMSRPQQLQDRTDAFVDLSIRFLQGLPDSAIIRRMAGQLQDASSSVGANYRAARRAKSHADFVSKIGTVSEEADESVFWLERMIAAEVQSSTVSIKVLYAEAEELARIFGAAHRTAKRRGRRSGSGG